MNAITLLSKLPAKKSEPLKLITWSIYKIAAKQTWMGEVEAPDEAAAIERAAAEFKVPASKLMAVRAQSGPKGG